MSKSLDRDIRTLRLMIGIYCRHHGAIKSGLSARGFYNGSQFFITHVPTPRLDDKHSVFEVVAGEDDPKVVNRIAAGDKIALITITGDDSELAEGRKDHPEIWNTALEAKKK